MLLPYLVRGFGSACRSVSAGAGDPDSSEDMPPLADADDVPLALMVPAATAQVGFVVQPALYLAFHLIRDQIHIKCMRSSLALNLMV